MAALNRREFLATGAAGALALAVPGRLSAANGDRPLVYVTADLESHIAVVDAVTGRVVRRIATAEVPRSIERAAGWAVVAHSEIGRVSLIDTTSHQVRRVSGTFAEPRYTAAHPDGRHVFITDAKAGEVVVVDLARARVIGRVDLGARARHLSLDPSGRTLWVALGSKATTVVTVDVTDPARPRLRARVRPPFLAHDIVVAPSGDRVWVTSGDRGTIGLYDTTTRRLVTRIDALQPPQHVAFSERGLVAYVISDDAIRVHRLDGRLLRTTAVPVGSYNISRGAGHVFTPSLERGTLCLLDRNGTVRRTVSVAQSAHDACFVSGRG
jgi:DNA-binding beta-propeller fold protein YncE